MANDTLIGPKAVAALLRAPVQLREVAAALLSVDSEKPLTVALLRFHPHDLLASVLPAQARTIERLTLACLCDSEDRQVQINLRPVGNAQAMHRLSQLSGSLSHGSPAVASGPCRCVAAIVAALEAQGFEGAHSYGDFESHSACYVRPLKPGVWRQALIADLSWGLWLEGE